MDTRTFEYKGRKVEISKDGYMTKTIIDGRPWWECGFNNSLETEEKSAKRNIDEWGDPRKGLNIEIPESNHLMSAQEAYNRLHTLPGNESAETAHEMADVILLQFMRDNGFAKIAVEYQHCENRTGGFARG